MAWLVAQLLGGKAIVHSSYTDRYPSQDKRVSVQYTMDSGSLWVHIMPIEDSPWRSFVLKNVASKESLADFGERTKINSPDRTSTSLTL